MNSATGKRGSPAGPDCNLDTCLRERERLAGDRFTMTNIPLGVFARHRLELDVDRPGAPGLEAWYARLRAHPALAEQALAVPMT